jgi:integrase
MLALQTGLRACDIVNLKRQDINWSKNEIRIVQVKTNRMLSLHLPVECGNAIADYLLNARPECDIKNVFLCSTHPLRPIRNSSSMGSIFSRYMKKAGFKDIINKRTGIHDFRRTFGKNLLKSETSLDMLSELLGHSDMESSKPYIAIDEFGLRKCALNLVPVALPVNTNMDSLKPIAMDECGLMKCALSLVTTMKVGDEA